MDNFRDSYFQVDWDLTTKRLRGTYWGKQYDTGRGFAVTVINGGQVVAPTTEVLRLKWEKPDNTTGYVNATVVNGKFVVENIDQMFTVHGSVRADFELSVGGEFVASITFYVNVEKAVAVDAIESSSDFSAFQQSVADFSTVKSQLAETSTKLNLKAEKTEVEGTNQRIDNLVLESGGDSNIEIADSRTSVTKNKTFDVIGSRFEDIEKHTFAPMENLVPGGDFSGAYTWWSNSNLATIDNDDALIGDRSLNLVVDGGGLHLFKDFLDYPENHIIYMSINSKIKSIESGTIRAFISEGGDVSDRTEKLITSTEWERYSMTRATKQGGFHIGFGNLNTAKYNANFDGVLVIDLTETFGVGLEPTLEEMDVMINEFPHGWFDGTANLVDGRDLVDAKRSTNKSKYFTSIKERFEENEGDVNNLKPLLDKFPIGIEDTEYLMAEGVPSKNLFDGKVLYGGLDWNTGARSVYSGNVIRNENPIKVDKGSVITKRTWNGKVNDIAYVFEYDTNMNFIKFTQQTAATSTIQLDDNTENLFFRSQTNGTGGYVLPELEFYTNNVQFEQGNKATSFENHYPKIDSSNIRDGSITKEKLADNLGGGIASYYDTEKERVVNKVYSDIVSPSNAVFGHITDHQSSTSQEVTHNMLENYTNINYLCKEVPVSFIANTGDYIAGVSPKDITVEELKRYTSLVVGSSPVPYFITKGNHDDNSGYSMENGYLFADLITQDDWYKYVYKYFERYPQLIMDDDNRQGGYCYFDDESSKIRFIFMNAYETAYIENQDGTSKYDSMHHPAFSDKQVQWLAHKAFNFADKTDKEDWATVGFAHYLYGTTKNLHLVLGIINAYNTGSSFTDSGVAVDYESTVSVDYTDQGTGEFITFFCGDRHSDRGFTEIGNGIHFFTTMSSYYYGNANRTKMTDTQDAFDIVVIDRENKLIKTTRFGYGDDRILNYANYTPKYVAP